MIINTFRKTIKKFIKWICKKFDITDENSLVRTFENETHIFLDGEKQLEKEEMEKEYDLER